MHATTRWNFKPMALLAIILALGLVSAALAAKGGKGKPPKDDTPPPVGYVLTYLGTLGGDQSIAYSMNNSGVVVGQAGDLNGDQHAFRIDPPYGTMEDLNVIGTWVGEPVGGCTAVSANDVNIHGEIVGTAECNGQSRIFVFDPIDEELILLPIPVNLIGAGGNYFGSAINDAGDTVGFWKATSDLSNTSAIFYRWDTQGGLQVLDLEIPVSNHRTALRPVDINNPGDGDEVQIVTTGGFRLTLWPDLVIEPEDVEDFGDRFHIHRINDSGIMCGGVDDVGKGKNKDPGGAFRYSGDLAEDPEILLGSNSNSTRGTGINSDGDVGVQSGIGDLYHNSSGSLWRLNDLVVNFSDDVPGTPLDPLEITEHFGETGFPMICGIAFHNLASVEAFVLTPVKLP